MENFKGGNNGLVTLDHCTAFSNIVAGTPLVIDSSGGVASCNIFSMGNTTGMTDTQATALLGSHFIGVLAADVSAGDCPVSLWTEGVFQFLTLSSTVSSKVAPGWAVFAAPTGDFANSALQVSIGTGLVHDAAIGTLVNNIASEVTAVGGKPCHVKINPAVWRWTTWVGSELAGAYATASQAAPMSWPKLKGHA